MNDLTLEEFTQPLSQVEKAIAIYERYLDDYEMILSHEQCNKAKKTIETLNTLSTELIVMINSWEQHKSLPVITRQYLVFIASFAENLLTDMEEFVGTR
jgi:uncharacterized Ntn-hydrolase superfamily protein